MMDVFDYFKVARQIRESTTSERAHELGYEYQSRGVWLDPQTGDRYRTKGNRFEKIQEKEPSQRGAAKKDVPQQSQQQKQTLGDFKKQASARQDLVPDKPSPGVDPEFDAENRAKASAGGMWPHLPEKNKQDAIAREKAAAMAAQQPEEEPIEEPAPEETPAPEPEEREPSPKQKEFDAALDAADEDDRVMKTFRKFRKASEPKRKGAKGDEERREFAKKDSPESDGEEEIKKQKEIYAKTTSDAKQNINDLVKAYGITKALEKQRSERSKRLGKKIKVSTSPVEQQEGNSLITFYNAIEKGKSMKDGGDMELFDMLGQNFPGMIEAPPAIQKEWYKNFLEQGKAIRKYLGMGDDEIDTGWDYERVSGSGVNFIPPEKQHSIIKDTWNNFTPAQRKAYGNKDDSWNPADVSLVRSDMKDQITDEIARIQDQYKDMDPELGPAVINTYLKNLAKNKILIPISLKQGDVDKGEKVGVSEYNYSDSTLTDEDGNPKPVEGSFRKKQNPRTEMGITTANNKLGFGSHSMLMDPIIDMGGKKTQYRIENKPSSLNSDAFEIRELIDGKNANARGGGVPAPVIAKMVKDQIGSDINDRVGLGEKQGSTAEFTDDDVKYYADMYDELSSSDMFNFGKNGLSWNRKKLEPDQYFKRLFDMANNGKDEETGIGSEIKFRNGLRTKLRQMKIMLAMKRANDEGNLGHFLSKLYYGAGKQNLDDEMKKGPFIKVQ